MPRADQATTDLATDCFDAVGAEDLARLGESAWVKSLGSQALGGD